jgi:hypothetical protein
LLPFALEQQGGGTKRGTKELIFETPEKFGKANSFVRASSHSSEKETLGGQTLELVGDPDRRSLALAAGRLARQSYLDKATIRWMSVENALGPPFLGGFHEASYRSCGIRSLFPEHLSQQVTDWLYACGDGGGRDRDGFLQRRGGAGRKGITGAHKSRDVRD